MSSYDQRVIIPFSGSTLLNIPIEEVHVRYKSADPDSLVVKELWLKSRQWAKGKPFPQTIVHESAEWELLTEQLRDLVVFGFWFGSRASDLLGLMKSPAVSRKFHLFLQRTGFFNTKIQFFSPLYWFFIPFNHLSTRVGFCFILLYCFLRHSATSIFR